MLFGAALGLMLPGNLASLSLRVGRDAQGKAAGVNAIGQGLGIAIGPLAGAGLHQVAPQAPFAVATILLAFAFCLAVVASRSRRHATPQNYGDSVTEISVSHSRGAVQHCHRNQ